MKIVFKRRAVLGILAGIPAVAIVHRGLAPATAIAQEDGTAEILQRIAWLLFPMPALGDAPYERVAGAIVGDDSKADLVTAGLADLDVRQPGNWLGKSEAEQLADLRAIESGAFFQYLLATTKAQLFTDREVWEHLHYGGSSMQFGGYVDRGLNDIDWLEDA